MKIEAPLCRYHGGHSNIVGAERQSAIAPSMTRLARLASHEQDQRVKLCLDLLQHVGGEIHSVWPRTILSASAMFSENENDVSLYGDSDDSNVHSIQRGCSMQRLYVGCCDVPPELAPIVSPVSQPLERQGANSGRCLSSRLVCIVYLVLKDRCPEVNRRADC